MAHGGCGVTEEEEEHASPGYHVEAIERDEKSGGREEPYPEGAKGDGCAGFPGELGGRDVAVGVLRNMG